MKRRNVRLSNFPLRFAPFAKLLLIDSKTEARLKTKKKLEGFSEC